MLFFFLFISHLFSQDVPSLVHLTMFACCKNAAKDSSFIKIHENLLKPIWEVDSNTRTFEAGILTHYLTNHVKESNRLRKTKTLLKNQFENSDNIVVTFEGFFEHGAMSIWCISLCMPRVKTNSMHVLFANNSVYALKKGMLSQFAESDQSLFYGNNTIYELSKQDLSLRKPIIENVGAIFLTYNQPEKALYIGHGDKIINSIPLKSSYFECRLPKFCKKLCGTDLLFIQTMMDGCLLINTHNNETSHVFTHKECWRSSFSDSGKTLCGNPYSKECLILYEVNPQSPAIFNKKITLNLNNTRIRHFEFVPQHDNLLFLHCESKTPRNEWVSIFDTSLQMERIQVQINNDHDCVYTDIDMIYTIDNHIWACTAGGGEFIIIPLAALLSYDAIKKTMNNTSRTQPIIIDKTRKGNSFDPIFQSIEKHY